jgi:predicted oxidoreductase
MKKEHTHLKGPALSRIIAGAWRWNSLSEPEISKLISTSLENRITTFDHADIYGDYANEKLFGNALKKVPVSRQDIQLISKCGIKLLSSSQPKTSIKHYDTSKKHILASVDNSLKNLNTDYLDVLLIHRPDPLLDPEEVSETFGLLKQNGKVLHFGVSNFSSQQFEMLQSYLPFPLITNQIELSLTSHQPLFDGTVDTLQKHKVSPMAWSPLGGGKLASSQNLFLNKTEQYGCSGPQLALAWLLKHPSHIFPVIGTTQSERILKSARAIDIKLDRQDWFDMLKAVTQRDVP